MRRNHPINRQKDIQTWGTEQISIIVCGELSALSGALFCMRSEAALLVRWVDRCSTDVGSHRRFVLFVGRVGRHAVQVDDDGAVHGRRRIVQAADGRVQRTDRSSHGPQHAGQCAREGRHHGQRRKGGGRREERSVEDRRSNEVIQMLIRVTDVWYQRWHATGGTAGTTAANWRRARNERRWIIGLFAVQGAVSSHCIA